MINDISGYLKWNDIFMIFKNYVYYKIEKIINVRYIIVVLIYRINYVWYILNIFYFHFVKTLF